MKTDYKIQWQELRFKAIADIRACIEKHGEITIKNFGGISGPHRLPVFIAEPYVIIGDASATVTDTETLCIIADFLNQMP